MFALSVVRGLRPVVSQSLFSNVNIRAASNNGRSYYVVACCRGLSESHQRPLFCHAAAVRRRSILNVTNEVQASSVQPVCVSPVRCLSTSSSHCSNEGNLIYTGNIGRAVRGVKLFSYGSSMVSLCLMPHILINTSLAQQSLAMQAFFCGVVGLFTFITPVLLHLVTKGYVLRLSHDAETDTYTAVTYNVFLLEKTTVFHQRQVKVPSVTGMFTSFYAEKMGLLVNPDLFPLPSDYNHLMGYDKPFSFDDDDLDKPDKS